MPVIQRPRADPYAQNYCIRLLLQIPGVKAHIRMRAQDLSAGLDGSGAKARRTVLDGLIALERDLGLTADPIARLVQMPCIIAMLRFLGRGRTLRTRRRVGCHPLRIRQVPSSTQRLVELNNDEPPADLSLVKGLLG